MAEAKRILSGLSESDIKIFKEIKSSEKTKQTEKSKEEFRPRFEEIKSLVQQGNMAEAKRILSTLTEEQLRIFKLLKENS